MGLCKLIVIVGVAALVMQPSQSASIGGQSACICTREYNPICGTDGTTYSNKCMFQCEQNTNKALKFAAYGECVKISQLPMENEIPEIQNLPMDNVIPEVQQYGVPCICTKEYNPICGSDGETYSNKCMFQCEQKTNNALKFASYGQCAKISQLPMENEVPEVSCFCTLEYAPICASNGQTYGNKCMFQCEQNTNKALKFASYGQCAEISQLPMENEIPEIQNLPMDNVIPEVQQYEAPCVCTREYKPVCGSNLKTYSNKCMFNCAQKTNKNLEMLTNGVCPEISNLPMDNVVPEVQNLPLDGEIPEVQNLPLDSGIPKVETLPLDDEVMCACPYIYSPVCGTDLKTYGNKCAFECAQKTYKNLKMLTDGVCPEISNLPMDNVVPEVQNLPMDNVVPEVQQFSLEDNCICTMIFAPVCGSDGKTYSNKCVLKCAQKTNKQLELFAQGACDQFQNFPVQN